MITYVVKRRDGSVVAAIVTSDPDVDLREIVDLIGSDFTLNEPTWADTRAFTERHEREKAGPRLTLVE